MDVQSLQPKNGRDENNSKNSGNGITFRQLFAKDINKTINGVIKASDEKNIAEEVDEYVLTNEVRRNLLRFFDMYNDPLNHEQNGAWISGFFGSGKSHLLKMLSHILGQVPVQLVERTSGEQIPDRDAIVRKFVEKAEEQHDHQLAGAFEHSLQIPATSILFNIDEKAEKSYGKNALLYAFVRVFNEARGYYGKLPGIAKFEEDLESNGWLSAFKENFAQITGKDWREGREEAILWGPEIGEAFTKATGKPAPDNLADAYDKSTIITPDDFAEDVNKWLDKQEKQSRILFFVDEVGQFIGTDTDLMLNLQTITEALATHTHGRAWVVVTSQEDIDTVVGDRSRQQGIDFSKIQGRFQVKIKLSSTDAVEVIQKRLLTKKPEFASQMRELWNAQNQNLRTLFEFTDGSSKFMTDKANTEKDFVANYPFMNYEFPLFQNALRQMSAYNMFSGNYSSVGSRSMLAAVSDTLRSMDHNTVGDIVPFDRLYDGIASEVQSKVSYRIREAANSPDPDIKGLGTRLLRVLLMVRHIDGFKATPHNLRILLTEHFGQDVGKLDSDIKRALDALEHETYIRRDGDIYQYLTNEEQDVEKEIKQVDPDPSEVTKELKDLLVNDVLKTKTVDYGPQKVPFKYSLRIDGIIQGLDAAIYLDVITSTSKRDIQDVLNRSRGESNGIFLILGSSDPSFFADLRQYVRTNMYLQRRSAQNSAIRQRILAEKSEANTRVGKELGNRIASLCSQGKFFYNGSEVSVDASDPHEHIHQGLQYLISRYYTNFAMLDHWNFEKDDLKEQIDRAANTQTFEGMEEENSPLESCAEDVFTILQRRARQAGSAVTSVASLLDTYRDVPYGWPDQATLLCIGYLYGKARIVLKLDGKPVQRSSAAMELGKTRRQQSIVVEIPRTYDPGKVRKLRKFAVDFFHDSEAKLPVSEIELAQTIQENLKKEAVECEKVKTECGRFNFATQLDKPIGLMRNAAAKSESWMIDEFTDPQTEGNCDELLELREDVITPVAEFSRNGQRKQMEQGLKQLDDAKINLSLASPEVRDLHQQATELAQAPDAFRKLVQFNNLVKQMQNAMGDCIGKAQSQAIETVDGIRDKIRNSEQYQNATPDAQQRVFEELDTIERDIHDSSDIANIRAIETETRSQKLPQLLVELDKAFVRRRSVQPTDSEQPVPRHAAQNPSKNKTSLEPVSEQEYVSIGNIPEPEIGKVSLNNEDDVVEYLEKYRQELMRIIREGKRITL